MPARADLRFRWTDATRAVGRSGAALVSTLARGGGAGEAEGAVRVSPPYGRPRRTGARAAGRGRAGYDAGTVSSKAVPAER
ncbi:hypothetical protein GCM10010497_27130 [Streptomyces cinereoruber]|uniref:Uncharacterized protein n=1 Tax=Streptomyces cinereoruber TaxID=67260 RepID=A0AAV4KJM1_9ACTN|nr:hypothetical protein GCM10010497_27130 [Streptomyces cinereoruber]